MNQTDTPLTDALIARSEKSGHYSVTELLELAVRLERDLAKAKDEAENQRQAAIMNAEQRDNARQDLAKANADKAVLVTALEELADIMQGVINGDYKPDSFTLRLAFLRWASASTRRPLPSTGTHMNNARGKDLLAVLRPGQTVVLRGHDGGLITGRTHFGVTGRLFLRTPGGSLLPLFDSNIVRIGP